MSPVQVTSVFVAVNALLVCSYPFVISKATVDEDGEIKVTCLVKLRVIIALDFLSGLEDVLTELVFALEGAHRLKIITVSTYHLSIFWVIIARLFTF